MPLLKCCNKYGKKLRCPNKYDTIWAKNTDREQMTNSFLAEKALFSDNKNFDTPFSGDKILDRVTSPEKITILLTAQIFRANMVIKVCAFH